MHAYCCRGALRASMATLFVFTQLQVEAIREVTNTLDSLLSRRRLTAPEFVKVRCMPVCGGSCAQRDRQMVRMLSSRQYLLQIRLQHKLAIARRSEQNSLRP
jgi:hypothetical protein